MPGGTFVSDDPISEGGAGPSRPLVLRSASNESVDEAEDRPVKLHYRNPFNSRPSLHHSSRRQSSITEEHTSLLHSAVIDGQDHPMTRESTIDSKESVAQPSDHQLSFGSKENTFGPRRPSSILSREEDGRSADAERRHMREFYEREGWLRGPVPGRTVRVRRTRAMWVFVVFQR